MTQEQLLKQISSIVYAVADYGANDVWEQERGSRSIGEEVSPLAGTNKIMKLINQHTLKVIGEDEDAARSDPRLFIKVLNNNTLKAEQRKRAGL